jgi:hypothetical protein
LPPAASYFPKQEILKINPESVAYFLEPEMWLLHHHIHHANHHKFTIKAPRFGARFCQNPSKNGYPPRFKKILQQSAFHDKYAKPKTE